MNEYEPMSEYDQPFDPSRCKVSVTLTDGWGFSQCLRKAGPDGYCWQHNPERRKQEADRRYQQYLRRQERSPGARLDRLLEACRDTVEHFGEPYPCWCDTSLCGFCRLRKEV